MATPGIEIQHPNREKARSKATKATVILLLLVSAALVLIVQIGGWDAIEGVKILTLVYAALYLVMAYYIGRWNRGVLPVAAALAIIMGIFAAIAAPDWFTRDNAGFVSPALPETLLGLLTAIIVPVQVLLIAFSLRGFLQEWHVEVEVPAHAPAPSGGGEPPARTVTA